MKKFLEKESLFHSLRENEKQEVIASIEQESLEGISEIQNFLRGRIESLFGEDKLKVLEILDSKGEKTRNLLKENLSDDEILEEFGKEKSELGISIEEDTQSNSALEDNQPSIPWETAKLIASALKNETRERIVGALLNGELDPSLSIRDAAKLLDIKRGTYHREICSLLNVNVLRSKTPLVLSNIIGQIEVFKQSTLPQGASETVKEPTSYEKTVALLESKSSKQIAKLNTSPSMKKLYLHLLEKSDKQGFIRFLTSDFEEVLGLKQQHVFDLVKVLEELELIIKKPGHKHIAEKPQYQVLTIQSI